MSLFAPDILREARELPLGLLITALAVGAALWLMGAHTHRFWLVLTMTLAAGLHGLLYGPAYGMQPLVAGLLLAVATGALALSLVRVLVFAAGGIAALAATRGMAFAVDEPLVCVLVGGLVGVVFYRLWITLLASFVGALLLGYSGFCLAERLFQVDILTLVYTRAVLLNWCIAGATGLGVVVQYLLDRRRSHAAQERAVKAELERKALEERARRPPPQPKPVPWWSWMTGTKHRKAG